MYQNPLLLLHGALGAASLFDPLKEKLSGRRKVYSLNFPGHGGRAFTKEFSVPAFADDVLRLMEKEKLAKVDIFGFSMGGYVALCLAAKHPEKVGSIFTLGTKFDWSPEVAAHEARFLNPQKIKEKVPQFAAVLEKRHAPQDWQWLLQQTAMLMQQLGQEPLLSREMLGNIQHPVRVGLGGQDNMVTPEESRAAADALPNGRLVILPDMPHPVEKADPDTLAAFILQKSPA